MTEKIVICNWDSDSSMNHPITKERLINSGEQYVLSVSDTVQFVDDLIENRFLLSERVHDAFIGMLARQKEYNELAGYEEENFYKLESGYYEFGNYCIQVIESNSINIL